MQVKDLSDESLLYVFKLLCDVAANYSLHPGLDYENGVFWEVLTGLAIKHIEKEQGKSSDGR